MTLPARITQDDMTRAAKALKAAGFERGRIIMDLSRQTIEVIVGEPLTDSGEQNADENQWKE